MDLNAFIFPAPQSSFEYRLVENILWIPRNATQINEPNTTSVNQFKKSKSMTDSSNTSMNSASIQRTSTSKTMSKNDLNKIPENEAVIPCLYLPYREGSDKILVYFHGNAEDIGWAHDFTYTLRERLKVNVISMEYPGYGLYIGEPNANRILQDAEILFDFLQFQIGIPPENIFLFGRSIGSGPATYLAARRSAGALILMSPYTSLKAVAKEVAGKMGYMLLAERFKNVEEIKRVKCPAYFIHGQKDTLIPFSHTVDLLNNCSGVCDMNLSENMTHNDFVMDEDLVKPILKFLDKCGIVVKTGTKKYEFPKKLYEMPTLLKGKKNKRTFLAKMYDKYVG